MRKAHFVRHESCPKCGSRDNLGRYSDESAWCFGCHYWEPARRTLANSRDNNNNDSPNRAGDFSFRSDLPLVAVVWLRKYGLTDEEMKHFLWDPKTERLIYNITRNDNEIVFWQGRRFGEGGTSGPKYLSWGSIPGPVVFGDGAGPRTVILVEDVVSAIKVGRHTAASPLFGSHVSESALEALLGRFQGAKVWLDPDKAKEAAKAVLRGRARGLNVSLILSDRDPKEHTDEEIIQLVAR